MPHKFVDIYGDQGVAIRRLPRTTPTATKIGSFEPAPPPAPIDYYDPETALLWQHFAATLKPHVRHILFLPKKATKSTRVNPALKKNDCRLRQTITSLFLYLMEYFQNMFEVHLPGSAIAPFVTRSAVKITIGSTQSREQKEISWLGRVGSL
jgi:hypothetical protein